jgi:hypothetical protein
MKLDKILIATSLTLIVLVFLSVSDLWTHIFKSLFAIFTISLLIYLLTKENRVIVIIAMVAITIARSGVLVLLKVPGAGGLAGIFEVLSYCFIPLLLIDCFKMGIREKIFSISLTMLLLLPFFLTINFIMSYESRAQISLIIMLFILWTLYKKYEFREDIKRLLIMLGIFSFYYWQI